MDIKAWMTSNFLKLNEDKTEILVISNITDIAQHMPSVKIGDVAIEASSTAKNLGVIYNKKINIWMHISMQPVKEHLGKIATSAESDHLGIRRLQLLLFTHL